VGDECNLTIDFSGAAIVSADLTCSIDPAEKCVLSAGDIDGGEGGTVFQKAALSPAINELAYNLSLGVDPVGGSGAAVRGIDSREGILGVLSRDNGTKQDTQGQHSRQERAMHGGSLSVQGSGQYTQEPWGEPI
jgi:hypothetical protein